MMSEQQSDAECQFRSLSGYYLIELRMQRQNKKLHERKSEQAHIPDAPILLENAVHNECIRQFQALVTGNRTENQFHLSCTKQFWPKFKRDINCSLKRSNLHFL